MANITENLQILAETKIDILNALKEKKSIPTGGLVTYADAIRKISGDELDAKCQVSFNDDVVALKVEMSQEDITSEVVSEGNVLVPKITGDLNIKVSEYKSITYILDKVSLSNQPNKIPVGYKFETDLSCDYGYEFDNVIVMMNGINVTDSVFNSTSQKNDLGNINIEEVNGDITVSIQCKLKTYQISNSHTNSTSNNSSTQITHGQSYSATITADDHFELTSVKVTMNDEVIIDESWDELDEQHTFVINIPQVIEDVVITTESRQVLVITNQLTNVSTSNQQTKFRLGETYTTTLTTLKYYDFTNVVCTGNKVETLGPVVLNEETRIRTKEITLVNLQSDITITAIAERVQHTIEYDLTDTISDTDKSTIFEGERFEANFSPIQYFEFNNVNISHDNKNVNGNFNENTGNFVVNEVLGNISISILSTNIVCTVTNVLDNSISTNNNATTVLMGQPYYELLTLDTTSNDYLTASVTMDGQPIEYHNMSNGEIDIPLVLGDIVVTANAFVDSLQEHNTLEHYTFEDINALASGQNIDVILSSPRIDHGYTFGYDGSNIKNLGNGYKNLILMQHNVAQICSDNQYIMTLAKTQNTKMEDVYGPVTKTFTVSGSLYDSNLSKLTSNISGYDLYGLSSDLTVRYNTTRTGTVTVNFSGDELPRTVYVKMYINSTANSSNGSITYESETVAATTNNTLTSLSNFSPIDITSKSASFSLNAKNGGNLLFNGNKTFNVWFLVPNNITELEVTGQQEVPDGLPYFALTTKLGNKSITSPEDLRATPEGFNISLIDEITSPNQTIGLLPHKNPCVFKFSRIMDSKLLSSGRGIGPLTFVNSEDDTTVWYLYKPNASGYTTSLVSVTNNLTNVQSSNSSNSVAYGGAYSTTLNWENGRQLYKLQITMCGHDITESVFNEITKEINIPYVIGNVEILAAVVDADDLKKIRYNLIDVAGVTDKTGYSETMSTDEYDLVLKGDTYTAKPTFEGLTKLSEYNFNMDIESSKYKYMKISECYAEMDGERLDNIYNPSTNTISVKITGDCLITIKALYIVGYVEDNYYDLDKSDNHIFVESEALGSGSYNLKYSKIGETMSSEYNNITSFNI